MAVTVDHKIISELAIPPIRVCMSVNTAMSAKSAKGNNEYPKMLIIL